eukprot:TRINITY_DN5866_c0_g1_i2.p1 TRINITY_DN5866_c0_g1~~TRINITY_DN5866_c0_g1_i2.p1  ORF type:complete len:146 (-),score=30.92 TRINITY_DN5866_c0_g1_i2:133-570(-)
MESEKKTIFDFDALDIDSNKVSLSKFKGAKAILITNVASKCGHTKKHYTEYTELYDKYKDKGFVILAFPCHQFKQESKPEAEIKKFVCEEFSVKFPLFSKVHVNEPDEHELFKFLKSKAGVKNIPWNFGKFLVNENGEVVKFYDQ